MNIFRNPHWIKSSTLFRSIGVVCLGIFLGMTSQAFAQRPPNFVIILADDQGWNALSTRMDPNDPGSGSTYYQTPRLAQFAAQGMRFSQAYAPAPTCSPTRHSIQFGRSPASLKIFGADGIRVFDAEDRESLANVLKSISSKYVYAHLGKWHIGRPPSRLGYDVSDGSTKNGQGNSKNPDDPKLIFDLSKRANDFMDEQVKAGKPFFLQISHYADHLKFQAKAQTIKKYKTEHADKATEYQNSPLWAAMNENLDTGIGMVLDKIDALGITDNTYVIYTADNGYEAKKDFAKPVDKRGFYKAYPQRSHKYHVSEGGIRVPFIVRGPGITPNTHSALPVVGTDIFPTVMDLAGGLNQVPARVEGASLVSHLKSKGKEPIKRKDPFLVFKYSKPRFPHDATMIQGDYKLLKEIDTDRLLLFNLKKDIGERNNLAESMPELAKRMDKEMMAYFKRFGWDKSKISTSPRIRKPKTGAASPKRPKAKAKPPSNQTNTSAPQKQPKTTAAKTNSTPAKPNIVFIFIDDMGYGDIGPFGNTVNKTPSLDRMAAEGLRLTQFYVSNTACTPSRSALMTGSYAHRIGMDGTVVFPGEKRGLHPDEITIAELLKGKGYTTGCFGKWHLGDQKQFMPLNQGFDEYFGIPYSNDMWPGNKKGHRHTKKPYTPLPIVKQNEAVAYVSDGTDQSLLCEVVTDEAVKFIKAHQKEAFFLYLPHAYVHNPRYARPEIYKKAGGNVNRSNVEEVDTSVGRILDTLRELKLDKNTLVIFTSDNGGAGGMSMGPLRGGKGGPKYEGHMREPTITWWPGTIPAGTESDQIVATIDMLPSLAKLTGAKVPDDRTIDGKDALDVLLGKPDAKSPHKILYYEIDGIRRDKWKLVRVGRASKAKSELYDLEADLGEKKNLAAQHPELVKELNKLLDAHANRIAEDTRPAGFAIEAKPIISEPGNLPRLREFMGMPNVEAVKGSPKAGTKTRTKKRTKGGKGRPISKCPLQMQGLFLFPREIRKLAASRFPLIRP